MGRINGDWSRAYGGFRDGMFFGAELGGRLKWRHIDIEMTSRALGRRLERTLCMGLPQ